MNRKQLESIKQLYTAGKRIRLIYINDQTARLKEGELGTIRKVDDIGQIHVNWDCGSTIALHYKEDDFEFVNK